MHASQITAMETISATMPLKVSAATRSSTMPEGFRLRWRRDILAAAAGVSVQALAITKGTSPSVKLNQENQIGKTEATVIENAHGNIAVPIPQVEQGFSVAAAESNTAAILKERVAGPLAVEPAVAGTVAPVATVGSLHSRPESKATGRADSAEVVKPPDTASLPVVAVATLVVPGNVPAPSPVVEAPQAPAAATSHATSGAPSGIDLSKPLTNGLPGKGASAKPGPVAGAALASESSNHPTAISAERSRSVTGTAPTTVATSERATVISLNSPKGSPLASISRLNEAETMSVMPQALPLNHAASPSTRADLQIQAPNVADTTGTRAFHVLPSAPTQLDVGVLDGTHGWLRIRAELGEGGAVSASLTASPLAHESLRAALPDMAKYLGSEALGVTSLAVHRFAANSNPMAAAMATSQQNGEPQGHHQRGDEPKNDGGEQKHPSAASDQPATRWSPTAAGQITDSGSAAVPELNDWLRDFSRGTTRQTWSFGALDGIHGSWLNVCA